MASVSTSAPDSLAISMDTVLSFPPVRLTPSRGPALAGSAIGRRGPMPGVGPPTRDRVHRCRLGLPGGVPAFVRVHALTDQAVSHHVRAAQRGEVDVLHPFEHIADDAQAAGRT